MSLVDHVIALQVGTPEMADLRARAGAGEPESLKAYVYFCAWQKIRNDVFIPAEKKKVVLKRLVEADLIEVSLG